MALDEFTVLGHYYILWELIDKGSFMWDCDSPKPDSRLRWYCFVGLCFVFFFFTLNTEMRNWS